MRKGRDAAHADAVRLMESYADFEPIPEVAKVLDEMWALREAGARKAFAEAEMKASQPPAKKPKKVKPKLDHAPGQGWWDEWLRRLNEAIVRGNRPAIWDCINARKGVDIPRPLDRLIAETVNQAGRVLDGRR